MLIVSTFTFLVLQQYAFASPVNEELDDNPIWESVTDSNWIKLFSVPPRILKVRLGSRIEIKCEAIGIPEATVRWMRGDTPMYMSGKKEQEEYRLNEAGSISTRKIGLYIFHRFLLRDEGEYTCFASSGDIVVKSYRVKIVAMEDCQAEDNNLSDNDLRPPEIIGWASHMLGMMNSSVVIRCSVVGNPKPSVYWMDQKGKAYLTSEDGVLENGDLLIRNLLWEQMGNFKCIAENTKGVAIATTFVYPVSPEEPKINDIHANEQLKHANSLMKLLLQVGGKKRQSG